MPNPVAVTSKLLEVIVTSAEEAREAEQGGADRLEIVRALDQGGLTPLVKTVEEITSAVRVPVRVMLRETDTMSATDDELQELMVLARQFAQLPVSGFVLGFVQGGAVDEEALATVVPVLGNRPITFHRAFEHVESPLAALTVLKRFPPIDRVLVRIGDTGEGLNLTTVQTWQHFAEPQIRFIAGLGLRRDLLPQLKADASLHEVHVGSAARDPETPDGAVSSTKVAALKSALL